MEDFNSWKDLLNPEFYIKLGGFWLILFIIFAETGLFVGFFLPGDSLLFVSGFIQLISSERLSAPQGAIFSIHLF
jgi:membrane protein DedA with SNARE-associated domain